MYTCYKQFRYELQRGPSVSSSLPDDAEPLTNADDISKVLYTCSSHIFKCFCTGFKLSGRKAAPTHLSKTKKVAEYYFCDPHWIRSLSLSTYRELRKQKQTGRHGQSTKDSQLKTNTDKIMQKVSGYFPVSN